MNNPTALQPFSIFKRETETLSTGQEIPVITIEGEKFADIDFPGHLMSEDERVEAMLLGIYPPAVTEDYLINNFPNISLESKN